MLPEQNPETPEHINNPPENPLVEFGKLLVGAGLLLAVVILLVTLSVNILAPFIPPEWEPGQDTPLFNSGDKPEALQVLQQLADELAAGMDMPEGMTVRVHLVDGPPNAFAMLGGNIFITRGLLESVKSENGLAMVMAHELAHLKHRDPIVALGRGVVVSIVLAAIFGTDSGSAQLVVNGSSNLAILSFNRKMETHADQEALQQIVKRYGHSRGAAEFFRYALADSEESKWTAMLSTHPLSQERIDAIKAFENSAPEKHLIPLPKELLSIKPNKPD